MRLIFPFCSLLALPAISQAQTAKRIDVTEFGIYAVTENKRVQAPGTAAGEVAFVSNIRLLQSTATIPARAGVDFGFRYKIIGTPSKVAVQLKKITRIPPPGIKNPKTENVTVTSVSFVTCKIGDKCFTEYGLDEAWEVVPGTWTMELWYKDRKLASQSFNVVKE